MPATQPVPAPAPVTVPVAVTAMVLAPVCSRPLVNASGPATVHGASSDTPDGLLTATDNRLALLNVPSTCTDCGVAPASETTGVPEAGVRLSVAPGMTRSPPRIAPAPVRFRFTVPRVTTSVSTFHAVPPEVVSVAAELNSRSANVRPETDSVTLPSMR